MKKAKHSNIFKGESKCHLNFKNYICSHPEKLGLHKSIFGQTEYSLPSGDVVDILFESQKEWVAVEVKSGISDISDISRGLFQCIKYRAVIEAYQVVLGYQPNCRVFLALETQFPAQLMEIKNILEIEVIDRLQHKHYNDK